MKDPERHAIECDTRWQAQEKSNEHFRENFRVIFERVNRLDVRVGGLAALGGAVGGILSALLAKLF